MIRRRVPWIAIFVPCGALSLFLGARLLGWLRIQLPGCPMKELLGIPCATCGLTRCVLALARGRLGEAFHWHPVGTVLLLLSPAAAFWDLKRAWDGKPSPGLPDSLASRLAVAGLFLATWILQIVRGI